MKNILSSDRLTRNKEDNAHYIYSHNGEKFKIAWESRIDQDGQSEKVSMRR